MYDREKLYIHIQETSQPLLPDLKKNCVKSPLFLYFFRERTKIRRWNSKKGLIYFSLLGFSLKLARQVKPAYDELIITHILALSQHLDYILRYGWQADMLSIREYNSLVLFSDFCTKAKKLEGSKSLNRRDFLLMETCFLRIVQNNIYPELIVKGLKKALYFFRHTLIQNRQQIDKLITNLQYIFLPQYLYPSLFDIILAYNMVFFKKHFTWNTLFKSVSGDYISSRFYNCSQEVFDLIINYITELKKTLHDLNNEKKRAEWMANLSKLPLDNPAKVLIFYQTLDKDWEKDSLNVFNLQLNLVGGILKILDNLLKHDLIVMDTREKVITLSFKAKYEHLELLISNIKTEYNLICDINTASPSKDISLKDYLGCSDVNTLLLYTQQKQIYEKINFVYLMLREIAVLFHEQILEKQTNSYLGFLVLKPKQWRGKAVFQMLEYFIDLIFKICSLFKEPRLQNALANLPKIKQTINEYEQRLRHVGYSEALFEK